jgi:2-keto-4-pentenoate hydratase
MALTTTRLREAADRLIAAAAAPRQCDPVRDILGDRDIAAAYAVQCLLTEDSLARGLQIVGHKIGLTSPAVQQQLGVDQPDSGVLFADMQVANGTAVHTGTLLQPKVEAEIAFILADDLDGDLSESRIRAAGVAVPAIRGCATGRSASSTPSPTTARRRCSCWGRERLPRPTSTSFRGQCN